MKARALCSVTALAVLTSCAGSEKPRGRGLLEGQNAVLALSVIFIASALALLVGFLVLDRIVRSRRELQQLGSRGRDEEPEESEQVIAGIRHGTAGVPRWLYAAYVVIPAFAFLYVLNSAEFAPPKPKPTHGPEEKGTGDTARIKASGIAFDKKKLTLPANTQAKIVFNNAEPQPHNVAIYNDKSMAQKVFVGAVFSGPKTQTYTFQSPAPGNYYFQCDVHPGMNGTVESVVAEGGGEAPAGQAAASPGAGESPGAAQSRGQQGQEVPGSAGGVPAESPTLGDRPPPTDQRVTADNLQFGTRQILLPADADVTIQFRNNEPQPHNIAIYRDEAATQRVFVGGLITGPRSTTYRFRAPPAGRYFFRCDVHPAMNGSVEVR